MELLSEKVNIVRWILGLTNDAAILKVTESINRLKEEIERTAPLEKYTTSLAEIEQETFDFEKIKKEQSITPFAPGELDALIKAANVQEPIEVLLASID